MPRLLLFYHTQNLTLYKYSLYVLESLQAVVNFIMRKNLVKSSWYRGRLPFDTFIKRWFA